MADLALLTNPTGIFDSSLVWILVFLVRIQNTLTSLLSSQHTGPPLPPPVSPLSLSGCKKMSVLFGRRCDDFLSLPAVLWQGFLSSLGRLSTKWCKVLKVCAALLHMKVWKLKVAGNARVWQQQRGCVLNFKRIARVAVAALAFISLGSDECKSNFSESNKIK